VGKEQASKADEVKLRLEISEQLDISNTVVVEMEKRIKEQWEHEVELKAANERMARINKYLERKWDHRGKIKKISNALLSVWFDQKMHKVVSEVRYINTQDDIQDLAAFIKQKTIELNWYNVSALLKPGRGLEGAHKFVCEILFNWKHDSSLSNLVGEMKANEHRWRQLAKEVKSEQETKMRYSVLTPGLRLSCLDHVAAAADLGLGGVNDLPHDISSAKVVADALVDHVTSRFSFWDRNVQDLEDSRKMMHVKRKKKEIHASKNEEQDAEMCHERHTTSEVKGCTIEENVKTAQAGCKKKESLTAWRTAKEALLARQKEAINVLD